MLLPCADRLVSSPGESDQGPTREFWMWPWSLSDPRHLATGLTRILKVTL